MFGNPDWFSLKESSNLLVPASKNAWLYVGAWAAIVIIPLMLMLGGGLVPEAGVWLLISVAMFLFDYRKLVHKKKEQRAWQNMHFINDDEPSRASTDEFEIAQRV